MAGEKVVVSGPSGAAEGQAVSASSTVATSSVRARWSRIHLFAENARAQRGLFIAAICFVVLYNVLGVMDIVSTTIGLQGMATEANPFVRALMDNFAHGWIYTKLALQLIVTVMLLWFPHRLVLGIFAAPLAFQAWIVYNNMQIVGMI